MDLYTHTATVDSLADLCVQAWPRKPITAMQSFRKIVLDLTGMDPGLSMALAAIKEARDRETSALDASA